MQIAAHGSTALVTYRAKGATRHVLVWGAINALTPDSGKPQVRFKHDYSGGLKTQHRAVWVSFVNDCRPYDGPKLVYFVAGCKARDGSYWALQRWQRNLPHRGWKPWTSWQRAWELRLSHWVGPLAQVDLYTDWAFNGDAHGIFGRMSYAGKPVHGFHTTSNGEPTDTYGRSLYIDTHDSAYGPGWERETSIVFRKPTGSFCYSFWPTHDVSLPGEPGTACWARQPLPDQRRRAGRDPRRCRRGARPRQMGPERPHEGHWQRQQLKLFDEVTAGDKFCATQH